MRAFTTILLALTLGTVYLADGGFLLSRDTTGTLYIAHNLAQGRGLSLDASDYPGLFYWRYWEKTSGKQQDLLIDDYDNGRLFSPSHPAGISVAELNAAGQLDPRSAIYSLTESVAPQRFINVYGHGAPLTAAPLMLLYEHTLASGKDSYLTWLYDAGKFSAALLAATAAVVMYLLLATLVRQAQAVTLTVAFALGSSVWSSASQALWQQGSALLWIVLGMYAFVTRPDTRVWIIASGAAFGMATLCRPTSALFLVCVGIYYLFRDRRSLPLFLLAASPFLVLQLALNELYLGAPLASEQMAYSEKMMREFAGLGQKGIWSTPVVEGLAGVLISPSRGLWVFSPWTLGAVAGLLMYIRGTLPHWVLPLSAACGGLILISALWSHWWGGWSYGPRILLEALPVMTLLTVPVASHLGKPVVACFFGAALLLAVSIHGMGAYAYVDSTWNRTQFDRTVGIVNWVDNDPTGKQIVRRLWNWEDGILVYLVKYHREERQAKRDEAERHREGTTEARIMSGN